MVSVMGKERTQESAATLGDVLYARSKAPAREQDWATLVQSIAAGDQLALHALYERVWLLNAGSIVAKRACILLG
jgi:hypothetical protein